MVAVSMNDLQYFMTANQRDTLLDLLEDDRAWPDGDDDREWLSIDLGHYEPWMKNFNWLNQAR